MRYWLMKSEPSAYSIDDLAKQPKKTDHWEGIRNYQARNFMRDDMKKGDLAFFYHSRCDVPGIMGIMKIVKEAYPDFTAFDDKSKYFDAKSTRDNPRWVMVDVKLVEKFNDVLSLKMLKGISELSEMMVLKKGSRLSITPVTETEWNCITDLAKAGTD